MADVESGRQVALLSAVSELELIGDIVSKDLLHSIAQSLAAEWQFSPEGTEELRAYYGKTRILLYAAVDAFSASDAARAVVVLGSAAQLDTEHERLRQCHFARVRHGSRESVETTSLHLDILEDLRRVGTHAGRLCALLTQRTAGSVRPLPSGEEA